LNVPQNQQWHGFLFYLIIKHTTMKKYSMIVAMLMFIGVSVSSCSAGGKIGTKKHNVGVSGHVK